MNIWVVRFDFDRPHIFIGLPRNRRIYVSYIRRLCGQTDKIWGVGHTGTTQLYSLVYPMNIGTHPHRFNFRSCSPTALPRLPKCFVLFVRAAPPPLAVCTVPLLLYALCHRSLDALHHRRLALSPHRHRTVVAG
jgi:hypothetical protein